VYTRPGSFEGYTGSSFGWTLVHEESGVEAQGLGQVQMLDQFNAPVVVEANSIQAFRVVANEKALYGRRSGTSAEINTAALSLKLGRMSSTGGSFVQTPNGLSFIWNGILEYCQLSDASVLPPQPPALQPPAPPTEPSTSFSPSQAPRCVGSTFEILSDRFGISFGYGFYFTIETLTGVGITNAGIHATTSTFDIEIYTRLGPHEGFTDSSAGWELVHQQAGVRGLGLGQIQMLDQFSAPVIVRAGATQAFRLVSNQKILLGRPAEFSGTEIANSAQLSLKSGKMTSVSGTFTQTSNANFNFNGILEYCQISAGGLRELVPTPAPSSTPPKICTLTAFNSRFFGISSTFGYYFDIRARSNISIGGVQIHTLLGFPIDRVRVYTKEGSYAGYETSSTSWNLALEQFNINGAGFYSSTELDLFTEEIQVNAGARQSFYVISTQRRLFMRKFAPNGLSIQTDGTVSFYTGPSSQRNEFGTIGGPYAMNGGIRYCER